MNKEITNIKGKIVNLDNLFRDIVKEFRKKMGLDKIYFLMPNREAGDFVTKHSTNGSNISITCKELKVLFIDNKREIIFPKEELKQNDYSMIRWRLISKVRWKVWWYKIHAVMPIYLNDKILCLILFCDKPTNRWFKRDVNYLKKIKSKIEFCLGSIFLYNQALERVMRGYKTTFNLRLKWRG